MGEMPFKTKRASSVSISVVNDTGVNSNTSTPHGFWLAIVIEIIFKVLYTPT